MLCRRWEAAFLWLGKSTNGGDGGFRAKQRYDKEVLVGCSFSSHSIFADSHPNLCIYIHSLLVGAGWRVLFYQHAQCGAHSVGQGTHVERCAPFPGEHSVLGQGEGKRGWVTHWNEARNEEVTSS